MMLVGLHVTTIIVMVHKQDKIEKIVYR